ncbi:MAG TPA: ABC transporter ATP-binding protein [Ktedonobacteraceae bacterium]|nr:ABC transporter ATP-binding protein [Ktedonobacteraceae bacterium]
MKLPVRRYFALLVTYLKPLRWRALLLALLLLAGIGLQLLNPQILAYFIDTALAGGAATSLLSAGVLFTGIALANQGISVASSYLSQYIAWTATNRLRTDLVAHCLTLDMGFYKTRTPGELIERIDGDVDLLSNFFSLFVINLLTSALLALGILVMYFRVSWLVGVTMTFYSFLVLLALMYLRGRAIPYQLAQRQSSAMFYGFLSEQLAGTEDVRANGAVGYVMRRFYQQMRAWRRVFGKATVMSRLLGVTGLFLFVGSSALATMLGAYLWSIHLVSVGTVYLLFSYTDLLSTPIQQIQTQLQDLSQADAAIQRIEELLRTRPALPDTGEKQLPRGPLTVAFENVSFGYVAEHPVLSNISFAVQPGKVLGVLGRTGSGKTTLARLLFRLYDARAGRVCVGDMPVREARLTDLRRRIGMVTQDVQLFHASVRDNLTLFNRAIPDEQIVQAIHTVGLTRWFEQLADGLASELGAGGAGLSAGEAQLLAFARVFLSNPGLVILDEASSRLDPATEQRIERATNLLFEGRTGLVIAHRLSTIQRADDILILEDGRMLEYGPRAALANDPNSRFSQLLRINTGEQFIAPDEEVRA